MKRPLIGSIVLALAGCGAPSGTTATNNQADAGDAATGPGDAGSGQATIGGSVNGNTFDTVGATYAIHGADDPQNLVVYIFSKWVDCAQITAAGWDTRIGADIQFLEMKLKSATPGPFTVVATPTLGTGEASTNHTLVSGGTPAERIASGGSVTLATYLADVRATGTFDIAFKNESLKGTFDANLCAGGTEP